MRTRRLRIFVTLITMMLIAAACGDSGDTTTTQAPTTQPPATDPPATDPPPTTQAPDPFDVDGDGLVTIGIAAAGPRDDGGYYQAVVDGAQRFAASQGSHWTVIISDNITAEDAATAIDDLAQQSVDIMIVGASEIASPMADLAEKHSDAFWYCNCGAGWPESPFYAQSQDDGSEIHYTVGVAAGLLMQEAGGDSMVMLGCCDLGFEKEAFLATQMGLQAVDPTFTITYVQTGGFPFDFENTANAIEAFNNALAEGVVGVYGYLGGAANPVGQAANEADIFNIAAGPGRRMHTDGRCVEYDCGIRRRRICRGDLPADHQRRHRRGFDQAVPRWGRPRARCPHVQRDCGAAGGARCGVRAGRYRRSGR